MEKKNVPFYIHGKKNIKISNRKKDKEHSQVSHQKIEFLSVGKTFKLNSNQGNSTFNNEASVCA